MEQRAFYKGQFAYISVTYTYNLVLIHISKTVICIFTKPLHFTMYFWSIPNSKAECQKHQTSGFNNSRNSKHNNLANPGLGLTFVSIFSPTLHRCVAVTFPFSANLLPTHNRHCACGVSLIHCWQTAIHLLTVTRI